MGVKGGVKGVGGQGGVKGGGVKGVPGNMGQTHRWLSVGGGGCTYVRTLRTYVRTYIFGKKMKFQLDLPMGPGPTSPSDFFLEITNCTALSVQVLSHTITPCVQL